MTQLESGKQNVRMDNLLVLSVKELTHEQKKRRVDLLSTILLSLSAVLSALSAYQASRWYSEMNLNLGETKTDEHMLQVILLWGGILILFFGVFMIAKLPWNVGF